MEKLDEQLNSHLEQNEKPKFLYHASSLELDKIEPRNRSVRDKDEGPVVFGTQDLAYASMFLNKTDDSWTMKGWHNKAYVIVVSDEKRFRESDNGGFVYKFSSDDFYTDETKSMGTREWVSKKPVSVSDKIVFPSGLEAMIDSGVQVYFVEQETFNRIKSSNDHGSAILKNIQSENQKLGKNVVDFLD